MKQKIEWYREVLELEPGSRVFFPLAKLLAADGQTSDAVFTLKQGLLRHPDHVEARLLLVELLHLQNAGPELWVEIDGLGALFSSYPGFWSAWSERLSDTPALSDAALAMRFFSAALQGKQVSWGAIIEQGLQNLLGSGETQAPSSSALLHTDARTLAAMHKAASLQEQPQEASFAAPLPVEEEAADLEPADSVAELDDGAEEETDEAFSLRTRSMAEVLAEQGDMAGALEIYQELIQEAAPEEKASLQERVEELRAKLHSSPVSEDASSAKSAVPGSESTRLVGLLESLAQRLEARAR